MKDLCISLWRQGRFADAESYQRFAYVCAAVLFASGLFHLGVFLVDGGSWHGPISWRKPVVFGLSFGITVATVTWFLTFLRFRRVTGWIVLSILAIASLAEVFLISMQKWRGVESHFNDSTAFDEMVFSWMGMLVAMIGLVTVFVTVRSFFRIDAAPSLAWAIRMGLVLMLVSLGIGGQMIAEGGNTFGAAGSMKLTHAITLHAVQVLPALALLLGLSETSEGHRVRIVVLGAVGYAGMIGAAAMQTYGGVSPLDVSVWSTAVALAGLALLGAAGLIAVRGLRARRRPVSHVGARRRG